MLAFLLFSAPNAFCANHNKNGTIITKVKSNFIDIKRKSQTIDFIDNAVVEREDASFLADKMTAYYYENSDKKAENNQTGQSKSIKKIDAWGNVKVFNEEFTATGDSGVYDPALGEFILLDNVIFNNGTSLAKGEKFVYNLNTKKGYLVGVKNQENTTPENNEDHRVTVIIGDDVGKGDKKKK